MGADKSCGHCFYPRAADQGSPNVQTNNIPQVRVGDHYPVHVCGLAFHDGNASQGSPNVQVNFQPIHRNGDAISCGDTACNGSGNVRANS